MVLSLGLIVLHNSSHNPRRSLIEVYDHPQPPASIDVPPIEALPARDRIQRVEVGAGDRTHDDLDMVEQPRTTPSQVQTGACVKHDNAPARITCLGKLK